MSSDARLRFGGGGMPSRPWSEGHSLVAMGSVAVGIGVSLPGSS